ncbi:MAG: Cof-type HAD-IIB family hydrolase [Ktedonobacteraceae bacterium]
MSCRGEQSLDERERLSGQTSAFKLVAIDIDGTLVDSHNRLPARLPPLIREVRGRGIEVTLASGRAKLKVLPLIKELGLTLPYISSGGAYIADPADHTVIHYRSLAQPEVVEIVEIARAAKAPIIAQEPDHLYYEGSLEVLERLIAISKMNITGVENSEVEIIQVEDILQACSEPDKITICGDPANLLEIEEKFRLRKLPLYMTYSAPTYLEITRSGVNKGEALKWLAAHLAIPMERILVIGDSRNDLSMFEVAGMAVAMGNASAEVKAAADLIAPSNDEGGVAWVLRKLAGRKERET